VRLLQERGVDLIKTYDMRHDLDDVLAGVQAAAGSTAPGSWSEGR
jgi:hypothetical protein